MTYEHFHAVQFYRDDQSLSSVVGSFLAEGLRQNQPALVVATPEHRAQIDEVLGADFDVTRLKQLGDLIVLDARETIHTFMADGMPHWRLFRHVIGRTLDDIARIHSGRTIRAYGEMVNVLWEDGLTAAALRLEALWNEMAKAHKFKLLCGYSMCNVYKDAAVGEITRQHTHLFADDGVQATIN